MSKNRKSPCRKCKGLCRRYLSLLIDTPETQDEYDDTRGARRNK